MEKKDYFVFEKETPLKQSYFWLSGKEFLSPSWKKRFQKCDFWPSVLGF